MATAKKLPSGNWRVQVYAGKDVNGKTISKSFTASTKKEAEYRAAQFQAHYKEVNRDETNMTLREAMGKYIESRSGVLSPTTSRSYGAILRNRLPGLMDVKLNRLTQNRIQLAINEEAKSHSPKTVKNVYGLLTATLGVYHPDLADQLSKRPPKMPQKIKTEPTVLTVDQIDILVHAIRGDVMELPILLSLWLCLRQSEICGLTWDCVYYDRRMMHINKARVMTNRSTVALKAPKTASSDRWVDMPPYIENLLREAQDTSSGEYVTTLSGDSMRNRLKTILKRNDLPKIRFHDLRHSNASLMAYLGVPQYLAQRRGGWATPHTMNQVYTHEIESGKRIADEMVNSFFEEIISHEI